MADKEKLGILLTVFVMLLIAFPLIDIVGDVSVGATQLSTLQETVTITGGQGALSQRAVSTLFFFGNATNNTLKSPLIVIGAQVNFTRNGTIKVTQDFNHTGAADGNFVFGNGVYTANYTYEGANYIGDSNSRTVLGFNALWFALAILAIAALAFYKNWDDWF